MGGAMDSRTIQIIVKCGETMRQPLVPHWLHLVGHDPSSWALVMLYRTLLPGYINIPQRMIVSPSPFHHPPSLFQDPAEVGPADIDVISCSFMVIFMPMSMTSMSKTLQGVRELFHADRLI